MIPPRVSSIDHVLSTRVCLHIMAQTYTESIYCTRYLVSFVPQVQYLISFCVSMAIYVRTITMYVHSPFAFATPEGPRSKCSCYLPSSQQNGQPLDVDCTRRKHVYIIPRLNPASKPRRNFEESDPAAKRCSWCLWEKAALHSWC